LDPPVQSKPIEPGHFPTNAGVSVDEVMRIRDEHAALAACARIVARPHQ
jgi:hypothetical protein